VANSIILIIKSFSFKKELFPFLFNIAQVEGIVPIEGVGALKELTFVQFKIATSGFD
jgi:hypothetical protein